MRCPKCGQGATSPGCSATGSGVECVPLGMVIGPPPTTFPAPPGVTEPGEVDPSDSAPFSAASMAWELGLADSRGSRASARRPFGCATCGRSYQVSGMLAPSILPAALQVVARLGRANAPLIGVALVAVLAGGLLALPVVHAGGVIVFLFLLAITAHELGHVLALRLSAGDAPALFLARTGSGRVIRGALPRRAEVAVVVAGPLAPLAVVGVWAIVSPRPLLAFAFGIVLAISHALLLLVPSSDRAALFDAFREPADHH